MAALRPRSGCNAEIVFQQRRYARRDHLAVADAAEPASGRDQQRRRRRCLVRKLKSRLNSRSHLGFVHTYRFVAAAALSSTGICGSSREALTVQPITASSTTRPSPPPPPASSSLASPHPLPSTGRRLRRSHRLLLHSRIVRPRCRLEYQARTYPHMHLSANSAT
jgi:hypothetical protein